MSIQDAKRNQDQCLLLMERIQPLLLGIIQLHMENAELPPARLKDIGKFTETLHKIYVFVEAQHDGGIFKRWFRANENSALFKDCKAGLEHAFKALEMQTGVWRNAEDMRRDAEKIHEELMDMVAGISSDRTQSDILSSLQSGQSSSDSLSMLPAEPKIYHGREAEVELIINNLSQGPTRIVILGPGGIGKTSLARAVLHIPLVISKFTRRFFVPCDSAPTCSELTALIGMHLGSEPAANQTKSIVRFFSTSPPTLLVLDNFETPWENAEDRRDVEKFLSLLADVAQLALIVTMRGAERPAGVQWTRPFMPPLAPLTNEAALQTFIDIVDDVRDMREVQKLLALTDNLPLAVDIIAHLTDYEGCDIVLSKWGDQKTSLLALGTDKKSSLDISIELSLSSPRVSALPNAKHLLSVLSILPDGLADSDLQHSDIVPIEDILTCKATLLRTSLGYVTSDHPPRLKLLAPIREYFATMYPPMHTHVHALQEHFHQLLKIYSNNFGYATGASAVRRLASNRGNIRSILLLGLDPTKNPDQKATVEAAIALNHFNRLTGQGGSDAMRMLPVALATLQDNDLDARFVTEVLSSWLINPQPDAESFIADGQRALSRLNNPALESAFVSQVGEYYRVHRNEFSVARKHFERAVALGAGCGDTNTQCSSHVRFAWLLWQEGNYKESQIHSQEAQRLAELAGSLYPQIRALHIEAMACIGLADYKRSSSLCQRARTLLDLCGITEGIPFMSLMNVEAEITLIKTEYGAARGIQAEIVKRSSAERTPFSLAFAQLNIAAIDSIIGASRDEVLQNIEAARALFRAVNVPMGLAYCDMVEADLDLREGNFIAARSVLKKVFGTYYRRNTDFTMYCLERLGDPTPWGSGGRFSSTWTFVFLAQATQAGRKLELFEALRCLGDVFVSEGDTETGESLFRTALDGFTRMDIHRRRVECLQQLGDIFIARGNESAQWRLGRRRVLCLNALAQIDEKLRGVEVCDGHVEASLIQV